MIVTRDRLKMWNDFVGEMPGITSAIRRCRRRTPDTSYQLDLHRFLLQFAVRASAGQLQLCAWTARLYWQKLNDLAGSRYRFNSPGAVLYGAA